MASGVELVEVEEAERCSRPGAEASSPRRELAYARARVDPERRLAARLAAKRAACRLLGGDAPARRGRGGARRRYGPPSLRLSGAARERMRALGAGRALVSLTHERRTRRRSWCCSGTTGEPGGPASRGSPWSRVVGGAAALVYFAYAPVGDTAPHPFNHDRNAVWLEHRWLERPHPEAEMEALFAKLRGAGHRPTPTRT